MASLRIPVRYYRVYREGEPYGCGEKDFHYVQHELEFPVSQAALVLVDCWSIHYCESYLSRAKTIMEERVALSVVAARKAGMAIIHAPSSTLAKKYPQAQRWLEAGDREETLRYAPVDPEWPPKEFVDKTGICAAFKRDFSPPSQTWKEQYKEMRIAEAVAPEPGDYVIVSGSHLHRVLKNLGVLHLFYAGFATNMCLQHRDYGIRAMSERGYNLILLRDCTTALEAHDTVDELLATKAFVWETEHKYAFSVESREFIEACQRLEAR